MDSKDSFKIMEDFALQLSENKLGDELLNALQKKHPFRHFKYVIDQSPEIRQISNHVPSVNPVELKWHKVSR